VAISIGDRVNGWLVRRKIERGGNGTVWEIEGEDGRPAALKVLHRFSRDGYPRFKREVKIMSALDADDIAILPILEARVPARVSKANPPWYVMPLATGLMKALEGQPLAERVDAVRQIALTLARLSPELHHRDEDLTGDRILGPSRHLPSEVFVRAREPDWERVDVHCLANTLWVLVTQQEAPPVGQIRAGGEYDLTRYTREGYAGQLSVIIEGATSESPDDRPSLAAFAQQLADWLEGREIRDALVREDERMRRLRARVLRHVVATVRGEPVFGYLLWNIRDPDDPSGIDDLTDGEVGMALDELYEEFFVSGERKRVGGGHYWQHLYPTSRGVFAVEDERVVMAQAAPLLRAVLDSPRAHLSRQEG
jgi:hypothetical protein